MDNEIENIKERAKERIEIQDEIIKKIGVKMSKTLSEELCEICGIKPKIIQDKEDYHIEALPDFTKPENFVKLFEIVHKYLYSMFINPSKDESFVDGCLQYLLDGLNVFYYAKEIKQAIREADWNWS